MYSRLYWSIKIYRHRRSRIKNIKIHHESSKELDLTVEDVEDFGQPPPNRCC